MTIPAPISNRLERQIAVVLGGSGVLGAALCHALADHGATVVILGRNLAKAQALADTLATKAHACACDVLNRQSLLEARVWLHSHVGTTDILVNCAGGNSPQASTSAERSFFALEDSALQHMTDLNYLGTVRACQVFGQDLTDKGAGAIVNIASMASFRPVTRGLGYGAAKAAVAQFTQWLAVHFALEYSPKIRVNAIAPGFFLTEQNQYLLTHPDGSPTPRAATIVAHTPQRRLGAAADLQSTLLWLVDPASGFITGTIVPVDGGFSAFSGV